MPAALAEAHAAYQRLRPAAKLLQAGLDAALDARPTDYAGGGADPDFTGFRRLALADAAAVATLVPKLQTDVATLLARLEPVTVPPDRMLAGAALVATEAASMQDPRLATAMLDGAGSILDLLAPALGRSAPEATGQAVSRLAAARGALAASDAEAFRGACAGLAAALAALREGVAPA
jgi:iron uptake system component EfeO